MKSTRGISDTERAEDARHRKTFHFNQLVPAGLTGDDPYGTLWHAQASRQQLHQLPVGLPFNGWRSQAHPERAVVLTDHLTARCTRLRAYRKAHAPPVLFHTYR